MELSPAEVGINRIRKLVSMWANPNGDLKARDAMAAISGVLLELQIPVSVHPVAAQMAETLRQQTRPTPRVKEGTPRDITDVVREATIIGNEEFTQFVGLNAISAKPTSAQKKDIVDHLQDMIDQAMHRPGEWCEGVAAGGSIASTDGKIMPVGIGKMASRRDAFLVIDAVNALPELLARLRSAEGGERSADQEVVRLQARLEEQINTHNEMIDAWHAERDQLKLGTAAADVLAERRRQVSIGCKQESDDRYVGGELASAAGSYALHAHEAPSDLKGAPAWWPWDDQSFKLTNPRRNLVKAGALILAEIERLDRAETAKPAELYTAADEARIDVIGQNGNGGEHYEAAPANDGWIPWESQKDGTCPVEAGTLVDVRYRDGSEAFAVAALESFEAAGIHWDLDHLRVDIVAYRLTAPNSQAS